MATIARSQPHFCSKHAVSYGALEQCGACVSDPAAPPGEEVVAPAPAPSGCLDAEGRERFYVEVARAALKDVARLSRKKKKDFHTETAIKNHREVAIKAMRAAGELGVAREDAAIVQARAVAAAAERRGSN